MILPVLVPFPAQQGRLKGAHPPLDRRLLERSGPEIDSVVVAENSPVRQAHKLPGAVEQEMGMPAQPRAQQRLGGIFQDPGPPLGRLGQVLARTRKTEVVDENNEVASSDLPQPARMSDAKALIHFIETDFRGQF